ncbi:MAG: exosortase/archaeosortase family protein [Methanophagales archaeon]|nr:exosortase/archaeosortase family protein [Methanophagales archaeon]
MCDEKITFLLAVLLTLLYFHTFAWLITAWLTNPYYSHGVLIPVISGVIAWMTIRKRKEESESELEPFKPGISKE